MGFSCSTYEHSPIEFHDNTIVVLQEESVQRLELWPAMGFNCFQWKVTLGEDIHDVLYLDEDNFFDGSKPNRTGIPILFPFPNRIRRGRFEWEGKAYELPINDPDMVNAIHGFTSNRAWRIVDSGSDDGSAWARAEFQASKDAPDCVGFWPSDYLIQVTYRLGERAVRIEAEVTNPDSVPLPFGLGYHPYFRMPALRGFSEAECLVRVPAANYWELEDALPTGKVKPVLPRLDLNEFRSFSSLVVDDILTELPHLEPTEEGLLHRATVRAAAETRLEMYCSPSFRELVAFIPPHRDAVSIEPYTCVTDAVRLQGRGIDAGWQVLPPGGHWSSVVELRLIDER